MRIPPPFRYTSRIFIARASSPLREPDDEPLTLQTIAPEEVATLDWLDANHHRRLARAFASGAVVYLAKMAGGPVHYKIVRTGRVRLRICWLTLALDPDEFFIEYAETLPQARGQRVTTRVLELISEHLWDSGFRRAVALVRPDNLAVRKSLPRGGWQEVGRIGALRVLGLTYFSLRPVGDPNAFRELMRRAQFDPGIVRWWDLNGTLPTGL